MCSSTFSAGNPHATFEVAGAGNVAGPKCWDTRNRKGEQQGIQTSAYTNAPVLDPTGIVVHRSVILVSCGAEQRDKARTGRGCWNLRHVPAVTGGSEAKCARGALDLPPMSAPAAAVVDAELERRHVLAGGAGR
jgi:hypothetical protein